MKDNIKELYKRHIKSEEKGIVCCWDVITKIFSYISILEIVIQIYKYRIGYYPEKKKQIPDKMYKFIEWWVVAHSFLALTASLLIFYNFTGSEIILIYTILFYGFWRVFEIIIKQIRVILFDTIGVNAIKLKGARRSIILLIHNIFEMICWFASSFMGIILLYKNTSPQQGFEKLSEVYSWIDFISCSTLQMTVYSDGYTSIKDIIPKQNLLVKITIGEIIIGFIIIVVAIARFLSVLPDVQLIDENKKRKIMNRNKYSAAKTQRRGRTKQKERTKSL
ncbi:hypothetical protein [Clostridium saccharoperbutylacetonicum]|uniref:hypothetical protein n=1 Tax=Clostridium saccharoperbutylacetonicum TaxID=36745 RepID=UPI0009839B36|nr:hypothetical protein [Clostridium saccharoperbutylacetonicum]AQR95605.1 hypothetical protein CLSAP_29210 [Clostridium saccharoperbutylacetonicum]NSB31466.1 hypothetical protein [Clostridium saccharoperbutylacetonicum]